jgi:hypothetical protein
MPSSGRPTPERVGDRRLSVHDYDDSAAGKDCTMSNITPDQEPDTSHDAVDEVEQRMQEDAERQKQEQKEQKQRGAADR